MSKTTEILAPAGGYDALVAAVRSGADAVYLGTTDLNARQGAKNFDETLLIKAVGYCHARGVKVFQTLNTLIFDDQLKKSETIIKSAANAGVDAFIIQDIAVLELAKKCTPSIQCHASTQLAIHNLEGVQKAENFGFSRVVLARELSFDEIKYICENTDVEIECFIHGALCMSVSGQCYMSSIIGRRSGNRGRCAQACRLPFHSETNQFALSLKDLSAIDYITQLSDIGVTSFKIEGRLKRPEYVAAAVTACKQSLKGIKPDYMVLENIFSRSGFTNGYIENKIDKNMFGIRTEQNIKATGKNLKELANLYKNETSVIPVDFHIEIKSDKLVEVTAKSGNKTATVLGDIPELALTAPTTHEKIKQSLERTGGSPFYLNTLTCNIENNLIVPASKLNQLRRNVLEKLLFELEKKQSKSFIPYDWHFKYKTDIPKIKFRLRFNSISQIWDNFDINDIDKLILPLNEIAKLSQDRIEYLKDKLIAELPRINFDYKVTDKIRYQISNSLVKSALIGNLGSLKLAKEYDLVCHGDFSLNTTNSLATQKLFELNFEDITFGIEYPYNKNKISDNLPVGIIAYGYLPLMITRNVPKGINYKNDMLTDRLGTKFQVKKTDEVWTTYNSVPLFLGDNQKSVEGFDFYTLYFTKEDKNTCRNILEKYLLKKSIDSDFTRGLYNRKVL